MRLARRDRSDPVTAYPRPIPAPRRHRLRGQLITLTITALLLGVLAAAAGSRAPLGTRSVDANLDQQLLTLTNQDRAKHGLPALKWDFRLGNLAEGSPWSACGQPVNGRAVDMIQRGYFSHQIPPCAQYVWPGFNQFGVPWTSAGENIGFESNSSNPAADIEAAFLASPEHYANIMGSYNAVGIGSAFASSWGGYSNVWIFSVDFALESSSPPSCGWTSTRSGSIQSQANGRYVSAELGYTGTTYAELRARATAVGPWERFIFWYNTCSGAHAFQSAANANFVSAELGYTGGSYAMLRARASRIQSWEAFWPQSPAFRSAANGLWVSAELGYSGGSYAMLRARASVVGAWEKWNVTW